MDRYIREEKVFYLIRYSGRIAEGNVTKYRGILIEGPALGQALNKLPAWMVFLTFVR